MNTDRPERAEDMVRTGHTFCAFHGNMHRDADEMQTESADRCIYEVTAR